MLTSPSHDAVAPAGYRGDIDGLRAIAILAVVLFHAEVAGVSGGYVGVDVFFVISGFLITGLLVREAERSGRVSLREFYSRRARRLLPLSFTTIVATVAAGLWLLPPTAREDLVADGRAASLYVANWRFAGKATDYSDTEVTDSLLVHFWSLAIEEQFYFIWPLLVLAGLWIASRLGRPTRPILLLLLTTLGVVSFGFSVSITNSEGVGAYYLTHTRLWEMAVGAGLALVIHRLPRTPGLALDGLGVAGLGVIAYAAHSFDGATPFPGTAALLPVLGCVAVIIGGSQGPGRVPRALASGPFPLIGRLSYAWYLFHWPAIGLARLLRERQGWSLSVGATTAIAVVASLALAFVAHHTIENPVRNSGRLRGRPGRGFVLAVVLTLTPLLLGAVAIANVDRGDGPLALRSDRGTVEITQTPAAAADDNVLADDVCHSDFFEFEPAQGCRFGDLDSDRTVVLLGDSHARQWVDTLDRVGQSQGWAVHAWTKSTCSIFDVDLYLPALERPYEECSDWRSLVVDRLRSLERVDAVILVRSSGFESRIMDGGDIVPAEEFASHWSAGFERTIATMRDITENVVFVTDTPWPGFSPPDCLAERPSELSACSFDRADSRRDATMIEIERPIADQHGVRVIDPFPLVCPDDPCAVVSEEGAITYRDSHHLTRTFALELEEGVRSWLPT